MSTKKMAYRGRFAPSPTGPLHIGSLYTAVASFLQARAQHGQWLLRIEDLDPFRCKASYSQKILHTLERYGLHWDEQVLYQSSQHGSYREALNLLRQQKYLYPCVCSRKDLTQRQLSNGVYDQHCLNQPLSNSQAYAMRIKLNADNTFFEDLVQGAQQQSLKKQVGDFIVFRKDQVFAYHLAVVVDDNKQQVTEVLRGYDLLDSTFRQIYLQHLLGIEQVNYAHIPTINDSTGAKLSKQTFASDISLSPVRQTLIRVLDYLNLNPPKELLDLEPDAILNWATNEWSISKIKPQKSIDF